MGKIIKDKYPELDDEDQEAVRQHAIAALNLDQKAKEPSRWPGCDGEGSANTAFVDGVRKFAMDVRELDIDLIDRINPFGEAYAILAKSMSEDSLKQVAAVDRSQAGQADDRGGARAGEAGAEVQAGARPPAVDHLARCLGEADGRRGGVPPAGKDGGGAMAKFDSTKTTRSSPSSASRPRQERRAAGRRARSGSSPASRRFSGSSRSTAGRLQHGEDRDIFERLYAVRLDRLREQEECRTLVEPIDHQGLLAGASGHCRGRRRDRR